jgi:hypothetical protein
MKTEPLTDQRAGAGAQSPRGSVSPEISSDASSTPSCRVLITVDASQYLDEVVTRVAKGFDGGRIGRTQIASWLLQQAAQRLSDTDVERIRTTYFDRVAYLETLLRRAKETGTCLPEIDALFDGRGPGQGQRKKPA